ncbi:MAG: hypothetical protein ACR2I2_03365 [Bryobacteraceae bacterium]
MSTARVQLQLQDVLGRPLRDPNILIELFSFDNSKHFRVAVSPNSATNINLSLEDTGDGIYRFMLMPTNFRTIQFFLRISEGGTATRDPVVFPVNPDRVTDIAAPAFDGLPLPLQQFLSAAEIDIFRDAAGTHLQSGPLYNALPPLRKAALLNLYTKSANTILGDGHAVFAKLGPAIEFDQDRLFARTGAALLEETMQDTDFHVVNDLLHRAIPPYRIFTSYKTRDAHGNLQLTFSRNGDTGDDYLVDMDIDEAQGIGHLFEVAQNAVTGLTNPFDVREILIADQNLLPLYDFRFAATGVAAAAVAAG